MGIACLGTWVPVIAAASSDSREALLEALRTPPNLERGAALYRGVCVRCHGTDGGGAPDGSVPAIAGQHASVIVKQLVDFRYGARQDIRMAHMVDREQLNSPQQLADVAGYVSAMERSDARRRGSGQYLARGTAVYTRLCASCHGAQGEGDGPTAVPRLAGQDYEYLVRQLSYARSGQRPGMSRNHDRTLAELSLQDAMGVADYLSRTALAEERADAAAPR
jgi:cytochrome c553